MADDPQYPRQVITRDKQFYARDGMSVEDLIQALKQLGATTIRGYTNIYFKVVREETDHEYEKRLVEIEKKRQQEVAKLAKQFKANPDLLKEVQQALAAPELPEKAAPKAKAKPAAKARR